VTKAQRSGTGELLTAQTPWRRGGFEPSILVHLCFALTGSEVAGFSSEICPQASREVFAVSSTDAVRFVNHMLRDTRSSRGRTAGASRQDRRDACPGKAQPMHWLVPAHDNQRDGRPHSIQIRHHLDLPVFFAPVGNSLLSNVMRSVFCRNSSTSRSESEYRRYSRSAQRISSGALCCHLKIAGRVACLTVSACYEPLPPKLQHIPPRC